MKVARDFYEALFQCPWSKGKANQIGNLESLLMFSKAMDMQTQEKDTLLINLKQNHYKPQEALGDDAIRALLGV